MKETYKTLHFALIGLPIFWLVGIHTTDISLIFLPLWLLYLAITYVKTKKSIFATHNPKQLEILAHWLDKKAPLFKLLTFCILLEIILGSLVRVYLGGHGCDHAIFSQAATNFAQFGQFLVTFNRTWPNNFLADHFSPILAIPGALVWLGVSQPLAVILVQGAAITGACYFLYRLCLKLGFSKSLAAVAVLIFISLGDVRSQVFWGTQVEYIALFFVVLAYERWIAKKPGQSFFAVLCALSGKESMMLWGAFFSLMVLLEAKLILRLKSKNIYALFFSLMMICVLAFYLYVYQHTLFFGRPYDYLRRIDFSTLMNGRILGEKFFYLLHFFLPLLLWPILRPRSWIYFLPFVPVVLMVTMSNFSDMWELGRQYVVLPATTTFISGLIAFSRLGDMRKLYNANLLVCIVSIAFLTGHHKPIRSIVQFLSQDSLFFEEELTKIEKSSVVISSDKASLFLLDRKALYNFEVIKDHFEGDFDYIVIAKGEEKLLEPWAKLGLPECIPSKIWTILCAKKIPHP